MPKILLCGNDKELIDGLFAAEKNSLMFMSTSENSEDIRRHLKMFLPNVFALCLKNQSGESFEKIESVLEYVKAANVSFVLLGDDSEIDVAYSRFSGSVQDTFPKELGLEVILDKFEAMDVYVSSASNDTDVFEEGMGLSSVENLEGIDALEAIQNMMNQGQQVQQVSKEKKKVLVIDDDPNMLRTLKFYLQDEFSVAVANSGQVALKFLEEKVVDIILLDYMMPIMDGPMTLSYIRNSVLTHKIPVIFLTGVSDRDKIRQILGMKIQGYLLKPVDSKKLHEMINKVLNGDSLYKSY